MNPAALLVRLLRFAPGGEKAPPRPVAPDRLRPRRGLAPRAFAWFAALVLLANVAALLSMDVVWPELRDPEYGRRLVRLKGRMAEHPDRPVVVVVGSSRCSMGVRPDVWEESRPGAAADPLLFNMSLLGSGPVMELLCLRRLYADGVRPDAVVLEYWPPFLREDGSYWEFDRIDPHRLYEGDRDFMREWCGDSPGAVARFERAMAAARRSPLFENRQRWLTRVFPSWLPWEQRIDIAWTGLDGWGWLPGVDETNPPEPRMRRLRLEHCERIYREQFRGYSVHPLADRALRESVALARGHGARVAFAHLPESSEFRGWVPPEVERAGREHLHRLCRELGVPLIDARLWMADGFLVDGFHLSRVGAAEFTRRFGPAVAAAFPDLRRGR